MKMKAKCIVAGTNANGEPDLFFVIVECSHRDQFDLGFHYAAAREKAAEEGYEGPFVVFDQEDSAGKAMLPLFEWETASVVSASPLRKRG